MTASADTLRTWFDQGVKEGKSHMVVRRDTWDNDNYPVYCDEDTARDLTRENDEWTRTDEVYVLDESRREEQFAPGVRAWNFQSVFTPGPSQDLASESRSGSGAGAR